MVKQNQKIQVRLNGYLQKKFQNFHFLKQILSLLIKFRGIIHAYDF